MTTTDFSLTAAPVRPIGYGRIGIALVLVALALAPGEIGSVTREQVLGAFTAVSSFVAATLLIFYGAERLFHFDFGDVMQKARFWQVPAAALLGITPGCGGAVMVVAAYASGKVSFGALVATLCATMGDAAFLLIAVKPEAAAVLLPAQFVAGTLAGWLIDRFLTTDHRPSAKATCELAPRIGKTRARDFAYLACLAPALIVGIAGIAGTDLETLFGLPVQWIALAGMGLGLLIWSVSPIKAMTNTADSPVTRMAEETAFISVWVLAAFLLYAYLEAFAGLDIKALLSGVAVLLPLIAAAIGLIPGCGPQIVVATLYVNGAVPFSALVANAISNDGDALFPAIALAPKAAVMATLWSTVPALIVAYSFHFLAPGFLN
jgi:Putative, 10TM heavy-metal exporter